MDASLLEFLFVAAAFIFGLEQVFCHQSMYHHVGVTTNRRGEVGIVGKSKTIVPDIVGRINRFGHGTNGEGLDERLSRFALTVIQEGIDMFVGSFAIAWEFEVETKTLDEIA